MTAAPAAAPDLTGLAVGDKVVLKRNLDHPCNKDFVDDDHGGQWVRRPGVEEEIGTVLVTDRREIPAIAGWGGREAKTLVRLPNGLWYDCATGRQDGSETTLIVPVA